MSSALTIRRALISVYDKTGIVEFARALHAEFGVEIISTGGTAKALRDAGIPVTLIENITGFPEMLDGRVKTLHPAIHAAILADRDNPEHIKQLAAAGIQPIDLVVVNLYPFEQTVADPNCTFEQAIEMIDIGGVTLLRAAAKNHKHVRIATSPTHYPGTLASLRHPELQTSASTAAAEAFLQTCLYDREIEHWLSRTGNESAIHRILHLFRWERLRYGENPHSAGELLANPSAESGLVGATHCDTAPAQLTCSYNNYLDADAALGLGRELARAAASNLWRRFPTGDSVWRRFPTGDSVWRRFPTGDCVSPGFQPGGPRTDNLRPIREETHARRNLPHIQNPGATYFVTFRLKSGELSPAERDIVLAACKHWHGQRMTLHALCVMSNHVHMLVTPHELPSGEWVSLSSLMHSIKRHSAAAIQKARGTSGPFWQQEAFDRIMRHEKEFLETWDYIEHNPVTARIVREPRDYKWFWRSDAGFGERILAPEPDRLETGRNTITGSKPVPQQVTTTGKEPVPPGPSAASEPAPQATDPRPRPAPHGIAACVFIKHTNACGVGLAADPLDAYQRAYLGDPNAAMGGILACSFPIDADFAAAVMETYDRLGRPLKEAGAPHAPGGFFLEVWLAPSFDDDAVAAIRASGKKWGQNVRLLDVGDMTAEPDPAELQYRSIAGGMLVQTADTLGLNEEQWRVVTDRKPTDQEMDDLRLAWLTCKHTKSNAITICRDGMLLGNGAGQMSRVMSCRVATWLARENGHLDEGKREPETGIQEEAHDSPPETGSSTPVAASDAFFPFRDGLDLLADAGITAVIQPGGSKRDDEVIAACNQRGLAMIFTGTRHFRH